MKYKEIKHYNIEKFTLEKAKLRKKGWKMQSQQTYKDGFVLRYEAQFIKNKKKEKDFKTFLKELDDLLMTQHQRLINITLSCQDDTTDFNKELNFLKDVRKIMKEYNEN